MRNPEGKPFWESELIEVAFIVVLICHIPFVYFSGKEAACIIFDEFDRQSISKLLAEKTSKPRSESEDQTYNPLSESSVSLKIAGRMSYKDMKPIFYLSITFGLFGIEVLGGIFLSDISAVFDVVSAFAVTFLAFWFPAGYYLMA